MIGVALEGGGARGAYHVGVIKALYECGYQFDGYVGTSIGAINAAALAQGAFDELYQLWSVISPDKLFSPPIARLMQKIGEKMFTMDFVTDLAHSLNELQRGVDTEGMKALIRSVVNEDRLRASGKCFGLATLDRTDLKPRELYLADIPEGKLIEYLMASASFPGFKPEKIGDHEFADGGLFNNCPVNLLTDRGFERVFAIRTLGPGVYRLPETPAQITVIEPSRDLGNVMSFDNAQAKRNLELGYLDGLRAARGLKGHHFFIEEAAPLDGLGLLMALDEGEIEALQKEFLFPEMPAKRVLFERILPDLGAYLKLKKEYGYDDLVVAMLESAAQGAGAQSMKVWNLLDLAALVAEIPEDEDQGAHSSWLHSAKYQTAIRRLAAALSRRLLANAP